MANLNDFEKYRKTLDEILFQAKKLLQKSNLDNLLSDEQKNWLKILVDNIENQKSVVAVTITSLLKKIVTPEQDIRLHREEFKGGYSGRGLDTAVVTPWLKQNFPRFAPKESGWLTRSLEQPHPFTMDFPGKIRNKSVKTAFLSILNDVELKHANPKNYLLYLFALLRQKYQSEIDLLSELPDAKSEKKSLTIDLLVDMLREHFSMKKASRLPVIAIFTVYQIFVENIKIYENKNLSPLKSHTTSDRFMGFGDIEIYDSNGQPYEIVEIKHNIPIDKIMLLDILKKAKNTSIKRYYILTTSEPNFKDTEKVIFNLVHQIKQKYNLEIIPNGIYTSLKYYLRLIPDLTDFLKRYTENLKKEFIKTADIKEFHINGWAKILNKYTL